MFPNTRLSVFGRTRSPDEEIRRVALDTLIQAYWKPAYKYLRLKWNLDPEAAADLTQEFFTTTLEKDILERYDPARSRFRTYLRLCLDGFAGNARKAERRLKRGGGVTVTSLDFAQAEGELSRIEPSVPAEVDELFYREWVRSLLERAVAMLKRETNAADRAHAFEVFARYDLAEDEAARPTYAEISQDLALTPAMVTNHLAAMRRRFREIVLDLLRDETASEEEWEAEAARLLGGHAIDKARGRG